MKFDAIIFDFDGVLLESEYAGNRQIAEYLTARGHPTTPEESMTTFMGRAGADFLAAVERWIGRPLPEDFQTARAEEDAVEIEDDRVELHARSPNSAVPTRTWVAPMVTAVS